MRLEMRRAGWAAVAAIVGWYVFALAILYPLTDAPVADSWLYASAVRRFLRTGEIRFAGFTQAMPMAQVIYGAAWGRAFGANAQVKTLKSSKIGDLTESLARAARKGMLAAR